MELKKNPDADLEKKKGTFLLTGLVVSLAFVLIAFEYKTFEKEIEGLGNLQMEQIEEEIIPITQQAPPPPPPPPPQTIEIQVVEDDVEIEDEVEIQDSEADQQTVIMDAPPEEAIADDTPFLVVEDMPSFPGCEGISDAARRDACSYEQLSKFLQKNMIFPPMAREASIQGTVYVNYVVGRDGKVKDVTIARGVTGGGLNEEALRIVNKFPVMNPGKQRGKTVPVQYTIPIKFVIK